MRQVLHGYPDESGDVLVRQSEESARIEARRYWAFVKSKRPDLPALSDDEILEEWMIMQWAWFDG